MLGGKMARLASLFILSLLIFGEIFAQPDDGRAKGIPGLKILSRFPEQKGFPGYDTLYWHNYSPFNGGYTGVGYLFGYGVKLLPEAYPAIVTGVHHRVFRLNSDSMQIRIVDDDGSGGSPGLTLRKYDTVTTTYSTSFIYHPLPAPKCTIWDGAFYLFLLDAHHPRHSSDYGLNWLRDDNGLQAPSGYHWRHDSLGNYLLFSPASDMEMGAVVEYHDVKLDSLSGLPDNDTVFIDSTYSLTLWCEELAGFPENNLPVILVIGELFSDTVYLSLPPNGRDTARLQWRVNLPEGNYLGFCHTDLRSDTRRSNDSCSFSLTVVGFHDVGCTKIVAPTGMIDSGTSLIPSCSVYNYGNFPEDYRVRMKIGSSYDTFVSVSGHSPHTHLLLTFPEWTASELGRFNVSCSTELFNDQEPENDKASDSIIVRSVSNITEGKNLWKIKKDQWSGICNIRSLQTGKDVSPLRIYNIFGELIDWERSKSLPCGVYFLRLAINGKEYKKKLIILK